MSNQPRLFADYAANPTRREREIDKLRAMRNQPTIFDLEPDTPKPCPVCAGDHPEADCTHGTAPTLPVRWPLGHLIILEGDGLPRKLERCDCGGMSAHLPSHRLGPITDSLTAGRILAGRDPHTGIPNTNPTTEES